MARLSDIVREQPKQGTGPVRSGMPDQTGASEGVGQATNGRGGTGTASLYERAEQELVQLSQAIRGHAALPIDRLAELAAELARQVSLTDELLMRVLAGQQGRPYIHNPINVAILATTVAQGLRYDAPALERLALAALMHDVGMWLLPDSLLSKSEGYNASDRELLEQHPQKGFQLLVGLGSHYEWVATVVKQEHERWGGQGYPNRLQGGQIHEYAQIIGLVDTLDAMINPRTYRRQMLPHFAVREFMVKTKGLFSHQLLKTLVDRLSLYPLGTTVRLNTGEVGVVSQLNARYPLRPRLRMAHLNGPGSGETGKTVDLSETSTLHIVEVLRPLERT